MARKRVGRNQCALTYRPEEKRRKKIDDEATFLRLEEKHLENSRPFHVRVSSLSRCLEEKSTNFPVAADDFMKDSTGSSSQRDDSEDSGDEPVEKEPALHPSSERITVAYMFRHVHGASADRSMWSDIINKIKDAIGETNLEDDDFENVFRIFLKCQLYGVTYVGQKVFIR